MARGQRMMGGSMSSGRGNAFLRTVAVAGAMLAAALPGAPARADGFTVPADLADHAVLSCRALELSGGAVVDSTGVRGGAAEAEQGHVRSNGDVTLDGGVEVHGDAIAGPGFAVIHHGRPSLVTGVERVADAPFDCAPVDLAALQ